MSEQDTFQQVQLDLERQGSKVINDAPRSPFRENIERGEAAIVIGSQGVPTVIWRKNYSAR